MCIANSINRKNKFKNPRYRFIFEFIIEKPNDILNAQFKSMCFKIVEYYLKCITKIYKYSNIYGPTLQVLSSYTSVKLYAKNINKYKCLYYTFFFIFYLFNVLNNTKFFLNFIGDMK